MLSISSSTPSIYQIRHIESGKVYVGSAVNPRKRWHKHYCDLIKGRHHSPHLQYAWSKYGKDAFVFEIIEPVLFAEDLVTREQHWIGILHASNRKHGFNVSPIAGSQLGFKFTDESREKMKMSRRGYKHSAESREKIGAAHRGRKYSVEVRQRISEAARKRPSVSDESRAKQSAARVGRKRSPETIQKVADRHRGQKRSAEARQRISEGMKRRAPPTEETKQRLSAAQRRRSPESFQKAADANRGRKRTDEQRQRMADAAKAAWKLRKAKATNRPK